MLNFFSPIDYPEIKLDRNGKAGVYKKITFLFIANSGPRYAKWLKPAPKADNKDGKLDICLFEKVGRLKLWRNIFRFFNGTLDSLLEVETINGNLPRASVITVHLQKRCFCQIDGEVEELSSGEYWITVLHRAINIYVL